MAELDVQRARKVEIAEDHDSVIRARAGGGEAVGEGAMRVAVVKDATDRAHFRLSPSGWPMTFAVLGAVAVDHARAVDFRPYANESDALTVGNITIENRVDRVTLHGDVELTRDRKGLALAKALKAVIDAVVEALEADKALPDAVETIKPTSVKNPFA